MKTHLGTDARQRLGQEVHGAHPELERAERMFHRSSPYSHTVGLTIQPLLHGIKNMRMFPTLDTPVFAGRALTPDRAAWASRGPVSIRRQSSFDRRVPIDCTLACGAAILVVLDLTRFSGHITVTQRGVHNVEARQEIHEGISVPDGTAGASGPRNSRAFQGIWS